MKLNTNNERRNQFLAAAVCALLMAVTGMSDSLRGVFAPVFKDEFSLSKTQVSMIISASYLGNLIFLFIGGKLLDTFEKKKVMMGTLICWMGALLTYFLTRNYYVLLLGMIFSMGASTLLSTSVNIITPLLFLSPGFMTNIFNFVQGVGISGGQNLAAAFADGFGAWQIMNIAMFAVGAVIFIGLLFIKIPGSNADNSQPASYISIIKNPAFIWLFLMFGFYCIPEHGLQNWLPTYASEYLGYKASQGALFTGIFFGLITAGRLVFSFIVNKIGPKKSIGIFTTIYSALYIIGIAGGRKGVFILCLSGLGCSIIWPTFIYLLQLYFPVQARGKAVGLITGVGTVFDIGFNAVFGALTEKIGFGISIYILPVCSVLFGVCFAVLLRRGKIVSQ
ncbi:MAG: MFS transporter [Porcipelethomonas sp.]